MGHLERHWTDWFAGLTITLEDNGDTLLSGRAGRPDAIELPAYEDVLVPTGGML
jgi:hypothetical protein